MPSSTPPAQHEESVKKLYQNQTVAENYIQNRFAWAWSRLLHESQVRILNDLIREKKPQSVLEVAPGPARIAPDLQGVVSGVMVEASQPMIEVAKSRLAQHGLEKIWDVRHGNAFGLGAVGQTFDFAFTFRFIRHFEENDRKRLYREMAARLNPSGHLVFDVVNKPVRKKLDAKAPPTAGENLPVFDVSYTADELREEMRSNGFEVVALHEVVRHFSTQAWLSYTLGPRLPGIAWQAVRLFESIPTPNPLEWVAVCRKA